jgi:hypothetical protein
VGDTIVGALDDFEDDFDMAAEAVVDILPLEDVINGSRRVHPQAASIARSPERVRPWILVMLLHLFSKLVVEQASFSHVVGVLSRF